MFILFLCVELAISFVVFGMLKAAEIPLIGQVAILLVFGITCASIGLVAGVFKDN